MTLQFLAIVLDGVVESAPSVKEEIDGGRAEITGKFTHEEAANLALVLQTGALPLEFEVDRQERDRGHPGQDRPHPGASWPEPSAFF